MPTHFDPEAIKFLRGLARNNDRDWFEARRPLYERSLKTPMLALIDEINGAMIDFAPEHLRPPHKIVFRIYRDTRFSKNKLPYKTHVAGWWARRGMEKTSGAGFYLQINPQHVEVSAGVYMPQPEQLLAIRRWMSANHKSYRATINKILKTRNAGFELTEREVLTRMPKGFAADDPADELIRARSWGVSASLPAELALQPSLAREIFRRFRIVTPLIDTLNAAILQRDESFAPLAESRTIRKPFF